MDPWPKITLGSGADELKFVLNCSILVDRSPRNTIGSGADLYCAPTKVELYPWILSGWPVGE